MTNNPFNDYTKSNFYQYYKLHQPTKFKQIIEDPSYKFYNVPKIGIDQESLVVPFKLSGKQMTLGELREHWLERIMQLRRAHQGKIKLIPRALSPINKSSLITADQIYDTVIGMKPRWPIKLILISGRNPNIKCELTFLGPYQFMKWFDKTKEYMSDYLTDKAFGRGGKRDMFETCYVELHHQINQNLKGGCSNHDETTPEHDGMMYKFTLRSPTVKNDNCGLIAIIHIRDVEITPTIIRRQLDFGRGKLSIDQILEADKYICDRFKLESVKPLVIILPDHNTQIDMNTNEYILLKKEHYYQILDAKLKQVDVKQIRTKRGKIFWDIETREDPNSYDEITINGSVGKSYHLKPTILCAYGWALKSKPFELTFVTNDKKDCVRQFVDWLINEHNHKRTYTCVAHNGASFDNYFLTSCLTPEELLSSEISLRGYSIINFNIFGHNFKDSCLYLTASLDSLCKSFQVDVSKQTEIKLHGRIYSNTEICFYKSELSITEFLALEKTDKEYWNVYTKYCMYDCISLSQVWTKFVSITEELIGKINHNLLIKCNVNSCNTIGSLAKKIVLQLNTDLNKFASNHTPYNKILEFQHMKPDGNFEPTQSDQYYEDERDVEQFLRQFVRGGISHCNLPNDYTGTEVVGCDIKSQYPSSMMYMDIPCGKSMWTHTYSNKLFGYWHIKNLKFEEGSRKFKPVAEKIDGILNWNTGDHINEAYLNTATIEYLKKHYGLISFDVIEGLVSTKTISGKQIFGRFIKTFYDEKANQDALPKDKRNNAIREACKLFMNSLSGKCVENTSKYQSVQFTDDDSNSKINGTGVLKADEGRLNPLLLCGIEIYFYSKLLLFQYIDMLPNQSDNVIHVETDSIYMNSKYLAYLENGQSDSEHIKLGDELGNLAIEERSLESKFIAKKQYYFNDHKIKLKGIPLKTLDINGGKVQLLDSEKYKQMIDGLTVPFTFKTMRKHLYGEQTRITSHYMTRNVRGMNVTNKLGDNEEIVLVE